jgi:hypothetical protein
MKKQIAIITLAGILGLCPSSYGLTTEWIGPSTRHPAAARPDWPAGIIEIPKHLSRVYSTHGGFGKDDFYFKATVGQINELLTLFSKARMRDYIVRIEPGFKKATTFFSKREIEYNVQLEIVWGIALFLACDDGSKKALALEPRLTILTGEDNSFIKNLRWPENLIVENKIRGVSINKHNKKPKRGVYYGLCKFANGSPHAESVKGVSSPITLWEPNEPNGVSMARIDNDGYFAILLSKKELAELRKGKIWLTITIGGWQVKAKKSDMRLPAEMLTRDRDTARPFKVATPCCGGILRDHVGCDDAEILTASPVAALAGLK